MGRPLRHNALLAWLQVALLTTTFAGQPAAAKDACNGQSRKGDLCLCELSDLHPTQKSVGMAEVRTKAQKLKAELQRRGQQDFLRYLWKHNKEEPVVIGPGGIFYITDHHHLARALHDVGVSTTYCFIVDNQSDATPDVFWKRMQANNEVYLKDQEGNPITPRDLPASIRDLSNDPFRSLAGAVRKSCGFEKGDEDSSGEDYVEFRWADYLRSRWAQTKIAVKDIDANFESAARAALQLAIKADAANLPGYTGKTSCY